MAYKKKQKKINFDLKAEIARSGYTQITFAKMLGISRTRLSFYVNGYTSPDIEVAKKMAELLNKKIDEIF